MNQERFGDISWEKKKRREEKREVPKFLLLVKGPARH
jgi:hypothetical protein